MTKFQEIANLQHRVDIETDDGTEMCYFWYLLADGLKAGIAWWHKLPNGEACGGCIPTIQTGNLPSVWAVESYYPLTLMPSIICQCHLHGFLVRDRWKSAV